MWLLSFVFLSALNRMDFLKIQYASPNWESNPFVKSTQELKLEDLNLLAVVYSPERAAALINEQIVQVGNKIGKFEVVSISASEVTIRSEAGVFKLNLKRAKK